MGDSPIIIGQALINTMALLAPGFLVMVVIEWVLGLFRRDS